MNILVIGNGFDLAHNLPTKYTQFLEWIVSEAEFLEDLMISGNKFDDDLSNFQFYIPDYKKRKMYTKTVINHQEEVWRCINNNIWLEYFLHLQIEIDKKENWIDFENEICKVIKSLESDMRTSRINVDAYIEFFSNNFFKVYFGEDGGKKRIKSTMTYKQLINRLEYDLDNLIRAFELYLTEYVEMFDINLLSLEIEDLELDYVISFNYTDTFEKVYGKKVEFDYIHGKAGKSNMVIGINEYLEDDRKDKDIEFIAFKKFYQRIYKETGCKYKLWIDEIKSDHKKYHDLYIFGHSLDITDGDVLRDLILNDNVYTTIYYLNKDVMGRQIANLVKVIGQDELIKRTGGNTKTIEFKQQEDMVEMWRK